MATVTLESAKEKILDKITASGAKGLSRSKLKINTSSASGKVYAEALKALESERSIGNLGNRNRSLYVVAEHFKPLEIAYEKIAANVNVKMPKLFSKKQLFDGISGAPKKHCDEALALFVSEKKFVKLKQGNGTYFLPIATLREWIPAVASEQMEPQVDPLMLRAAYERLVQRDGFSHVLIHDLQQASGVSVEALKAWLLQACRDHKATAGAGDWSLSTQEQRDAAIMINGQPHLRIRLLK